jgi:TonB family protein
MFAAIQSRPRRTGPAATSLAGSVGLHVALIGWMFFGPKLEFTPEQKPQSTYQQLIAPQEKKLVWYSFRNKLPEVSPLERRGISREPRAERKTAQTIVAKPPKAPRANQMVWLPAPEIELKSELRSPNMMAFEAPKIAPPERRRPKLFAPPPDVKVAPAPAPQLPDAPQIASAQQRVPAMADPRLPKPAPKQFVAPEQAKRATVTPSVTDAPQIASAEQRSPTMADPRLPKPAPKQFVAPEQAKRTTVTPSVADAPQIASAQQRAPAMADPRLPKPAPKTFVAPEQAKRVTATPSIQDAPQIAAAQQHAPAIVDPRLPKPAPKTFVAPEQAKRVTATPSMQDAPQIAAAQQHAPAMADPRLPRPAPKTFVAPEQARRTAAAPSVPDAPQVASAQQHAPAMPDPRLPPKQFFAPRAATRTTNTSSVGDAPQVAAAGPQPAAATRFVSPLEPPRAGKPSAAMEAEPQLPSSESPGALTAAIVGLNPIADLKPELPEGARAAQFAGGPEKRKDGGNGEIVETARIFVPDLMVRDHDKQPPTPAVLVARVSPTSPEALLNAVKANVAVPSELHGRPVATRVTSAPDPRLAGRLVYTIAIQMPNVTSFMGSWVVWFAERQPLPGRPPDIRSPVPLRKVDPKYIPAAASDRIEGKVLLAAVIRKDGHVDTVRLLKHLDDRLDRSAAEALGKWIFEPARRNGKPVDVDAVFEIPFSLAPLAAR